MKSSNIRSEAGAPVGAKVLLIDPGTLSVVWMNESAAAGVPDAVGNVGSGATVEQVAPIAREMGVADAVRDLARTGVARHLRTSLVSTTRGRMVIVASIYRMPDGQVLLVMEQSWEARGGRSPAR